MQAEIICVGTELLLGDILNTNAQFLARELAELGYGLYYQTVVGDNAPRLEELVHQALGRSEVLIFSGGLGPTEDDLTKQTVAAAFGDTLVEDPEELRRLQAYFAKTGRAMADNNRRQALAPVHGETLENRNGTAPGIHFEKDGRHAFLLPGPPQELQPMFYEQVRPRLAATQTATIHSHTLRVMGIGESDLENRIRPLLEGGNPTAALYAKSGEVHVRITARAKAGSTADEMCEELAAQFRAALGPLVYTEDDRNLETVVVDALRSHRHTVALAESCTGGLLAARLTAVPGASEVLGYGIVSYSKAVKARQLGVPEDLLARYGAVSGAVACSMARCARAKGDADFGVGITGLAGPGGDGEDKPVGLVYIALCHADTTHLLRLMVPGRGREAVRYRATQSALDLLRRLCLGLPLPETHTFADDTLPDY